MSAQAARHILPPRSGGMEETMKREWRIRRATEAPGSAGTGRTRTYCGGAWKPKGIRSEENIFRDDGYSCTTLKRPALDAWLKSSSTHSSE
jgi:hypothetical protein